MLSKYLFLIFLLIIALISCDRKNIPVKQSELVTAEIIKIAETNLSCNLARFSADGKYFVCSINQYWESSSISWSRVVYLYDIEKDKQIRSYYLDHENSDMFDCAAISPDGKYVAGGGTVYNGWFGNGVVIWDTETGQIDSFKKQFDGDVKYLEYSSTGDTLFVYTTDGILYSWNLISFELDIINKDFGINADFFHISSDGNLIMFNGYVNLVDISKTPPSFTEEDIATYADFLPGNQQLVITKSNYSTWIYDISTKQRVKSSRGSNDQIHYLVAVSPSGKYFATSYEIRDNLQYPKEMGIQLWETETLAQIASIEQWYVYYLEYGIDDTKLLASSGYGTIVYDIKYEVQ